MFRTAGTARQAGRITARKGHAKAEWSELTPPLTIQNEAQRSGFVLRRKKEGADTQLSRRLRKPRKRSGASLRPSDNSKRSPAKRVRFEEEEGGSGYAAFTALTETAKAEWSELLLTMKGRGQSGIGMEPHRHNRQSPVTLNTGG